MSHNVTASEGVLWPLELVGLQEKIDNHSRHALTAREWDRYEWLLKKYDLAAWTRREEATKRRLDMEAARRLSVDDIKAILAEKAN